VPDEKAGDLVLHFEPGVDQRFPAATGLAQVFLFFARNRRHRAAPGFATQPAHQRRQQKIHVEAVGLGALAAPLHGDAGGVHDIDFDYDAPRPDASFTTSCMLASFLVPDTPWQAAY
jgi:hypothetical protein